MLRICEREDPAYIVLHQNAVFTAKRRELPWRAPPSFFMDFGPRNWGTGFMPAVHQGVEFSPDGVPIRNLDTPKGMSAARQRSPPCLAKAEATGPRKFPNIRLTA